MRNTRKAKHRVNELLILKAATPDQIHLAYLGLLGLLVREGVLDDATISSEPLTSEWNNCVRVRTRWTT